VGVVLASHCPAPGRRVQGVFGVAIAIGSRRDRFAAFGGADTSVPAGRSAAILSSLLPSDPQHALAVYPGADHNLFITEPDPAVPLADQLAPGFMQMLAAWLKV
jgi:dienelactone hydrolase